MGLPRDGRKATPGALRRAEDSNGDPLPPTSAVLIKSFPNASRHNVALLDSLSRRRFMLNAVPLTLAALIAVAIIVIGCFYLVSPERISGTFGLKPPASDADTRGFRLPIW